MPKIQTTSKHAKMLQNPDEGRYQLEVKKVEYLLNKKKNGHNYVYTFEISDGDFKGKPYKLYCSESHDMGISQMLLIHKCITGNKEDEQEFDPVEDHVGGQLIGEVVDEPYEGKMQSTLSGTFYPMGTPTETPWGDDD